MALERALAMTAEELAMVQARCTERANGANPAPLETQSQLISKHKAQQKSKQIEHAKAESSVGAKFKNVRFANLRVDQNNEAAVAAAYDVVNSNGKKGLGVWGFPGVGKSMLIAAVVNHLSDAGIVGKIVSAPDLMLTFRDSMNSRSAREKAIIEDLARVEVLAIQDLGKEQFTDYAIHTLFSIMDKRWEASLPLIVTANLNPVAMSTRYSAVPKNTEEIDRSMGSAMMDRVMDMTSAPWVQITGLSRRGVA